MKRNFGLRPRIDVAEATAGAGYLIFTIIILVVWLLLAR